MKYLHTMVRVTNLDASLKFYCDALGLKELSRKDYPQGRYTLVFLAAPGDDSAQVELTYNWDPEKYGGGGLGLRELAIVVEETVLGGCPLQAMLFSAGVTGTILNRTPVTSRAPVAAGRGHRRNTFVARDYRARCRLECPWAKPRVDTIISLGGDPADDASRAFRAAEALRRRGEPYGVSKGTNVSRWAGLASR